MVSNVETSKLLYSAICMGQGQAIEPALLPGIIRLEHLKSALGNGNQAPA